MMFLYRMPMETADFAAMVFKKEKLLFVPGDYRERTRRWLGPVECHVTVLRYESEQVPEATALLKYHHAKRGGPPLLREAGLEPVEEDGLCWSGEGLSGDGIQVCRYPALLTMQEVLVVRGSDQEQRVAKANEVLESLKSSNRF